MGGFANLFKGKDKAQDPPTSPHPIPIWALATEPTPRRNGFGPRPPSTKSVNSFDGNGSPRSVMMGPRTNSSGPQPSPSRPFRARTGSLDDRFSEMSLAGGPAQMRSVGVGAGSSSPTGRRPLPSPPRRGTGSMDHNSSGPTNMVPPPRPPSQPRTQSSPERRLPQPRQFRAHQGAPAPPALPTPQNYPYQKSVSSYAGSSASSTHHSITSRFSNNVRPPPPPGELYPQALPARKSSPPQVLPTGPDPSIFRQTVPPSAPPSANSTPGSISLPFPGAFPLGEPEHPLKMPEPFAGGGSKWGPDDASFMRYPTTSSLLHQGSKQSPPAAPVSSFGSSSPPNFSGPPPIPTSTRPPLSSNNSQSSSLMNRPHGVHNRPKVRIPPASLQRPPPKTQGDPLVIDLCDSSDDDDGTSPSSSGNKNQCHGTTGSGKRCTRIVVDSASPSPARRGRSASPGVSSSEGGGSGALDLLDNMLRNSDDDVTGNKNLDGASVPRFCFQHSKQALQERGCFVNGKSGKGEWIEFEDWILPDLPSVTRIQLRHEMARPVSAKDEEGYIYVHEMVEKRRNNSAPSATTLLKLGRSVKPVSRLSQWRSQCPSREPVVRDLFPRASSNGLSGAGVSGALQVARNGARHHHRWERLILIEVAGRAFLEAEERAKNTGNGSPASKTKKSVCADCGKGHLELFEVSATAYDDWVMEIVERWERWCTDILF
ncbi:hypothetical protein T439DRAFT_309764 [Meredithblackwellia eburnea MCA 4105]